MLLSHHIIGSRELPRAVDTFHCDLFNLRTEHLHGGCLVQDRVLSEDFVVVVTFANGVVWGHLSRH